MHSLYITLRDDEPGKLELGTHHPVVVFKQTMPLGLWRSGSEGHAVL
jgi:hypothetical protein